MIKKTINQKSGPRTGNAGNADKRRDFISSKNDRTSYFQRLATMVTDALGQRGAGMKSDRPSQDDVKALRSISPDTRVKRGPTRGNR